MSQSIKTQKYNANIESEESHLDILTDQIKEDQVAVYGINEPQPCMKVHVLQIRRLRHLQVWGCN